MHVADCGDARGVATDQVVVCSRLVADDGGARTYESGPVGAAPTVGIRLRLEADLTWSVGATERR